MKGPAQEAQSTITMAEGEANGTTLEFFFGCSEHACKRKTNALRFRCGEGDMYIIVEHNGDGEERRVRFCRSAQEQGETDENVFLLRSDGVRHEIDLSEEHCDVLLQPDQTIRTTESTTLVFVECGDHQRMVMSDTHFMSNQDRVIEIVDRIANSSHLKFPGGETEEKYIAQELEFVFDRGHGGNTSALVMPSFSGEFIFFLEEVGGGEEKRVRACDFYAEEGEETGEEFYLMRPDGVYMPVEVTDDLVETLLSAGFKQTSESATVKARDEHGRSATQNASHVYAVINQQLVIEVLGRLLEDSYLKLPQKISRATAEMPLVEEGEHFGEMCANNKEEQTNFVVDAVESASNQMVSAAMSEQFQMCPEKSKSARADLTEEEMKWFSRLWNVNLNEENKTNGRAESAKRDKWFSLLWNYYLNSYDKVDSGQYILNKPPKKPGGTFNVNAQKGSWTTIFFFATAFALTEGATDGAGGSESTMNVERYVSLVSLLLKLVLTLGIASNMFQLAVKLWAGIELVCEFIQAIEAFIDRFELDRINSSTVHLVLFKCLRRDVPFTAEGNPKERVRNFFLKVDKDILDLCSKFSCNREDVVREYLRSLFDRHQALDRQRKGSSLSRDDRVRLQYSPVRVAEELISNFKASTRDEDDVQCAMAGSNDNNAGADRGLKKGCDASVAMTVLTEENIDDELDDELNLAQKQVDATTTTGQRIESLEDRITCESGCEGNDYSVVINGTLFRGIKSSSDNSHYCLVDDGCESYTGAEETCKERNSRLLCKERESMREKKLRSLKKRSKYLNCSNVSQSIEEKNATAVEDPDAERISDRVEKFSRQRETTTVDRRWEIELLSRRKEKLLTKAKRSMKATGKRVVWGSSDVTELVQYFVKTCISSAFRFASLRSNRSYKPGD